MFAKSRPELPDLEYCLIPRTKGFVATVHGLIDSHIKAIYDITLVYSNVKLGIFQESPSMLKVHMASSLNDWRFHVHVKRYDI